MNERIRELFSKSCWDEQMEADIEDFVNVEKFAQLIVKDCIATVAFHRRADTPDEYDDLDEVDRAVDNIVSEICGRLHTKFGVK